MKENHYKNYKGEEIDISSLGDRDLVLLYKFFQKFGSSVEATLATLEKRDTSFGDYVLSIVSTRDALKAEVQIRKLKLSHFGP